MQIKQLIKKRYKRIQKLISILLITFLCWISSNIIILAEDFAEFQSKELTCIIGNNAKKGEHRSGYNGVYSLQSVHQSKSLFVPAYAGLNLEHIFPPKH
jgi:hypothetical protein